MPHGFRIGCDIGGTFTDFVVVETKTGEIKTAKRLTTPDDPSRAMLAGLTELGHSAPGSTSACERLAHATTLIANAVIERKGAKTALLCTAGFRDVIELCGPEFSQKIFVYRRISFSAAGSIPEGCVMISSSSSRISSA